jgi:ParB family chromosome partitioning protein
MMAEGRGLGRGLSALIGDEVATTSSRDAKAARTLPVAFLRPNRFQPRKTFAEDDLADLTNSIREKGVLQPILVRPVAGESNAFEIVAGERRWRAAQAAQLHDVPVVVREMGDAEALELAIVENVQRADLNAIEEATAYNELMERFAYTQERIAQEVGKSRSHVANTLRLLRLPDGVRAMLREGTLSPGHARTLIGRPDAEARARQIVDAALNVREAEHRIKKKKLRPPEDPNIASLEARLSEQLGFRVKVIDRGKRGGEVQVFYKTLEQLDEICRRLNSS